MSVGLGGRHRAARRLVCALVGVLAVAGACAPGGGGSSLATGRPEGFEPLAVGVVAAGELVASGAPDGGGGLVLVSAGTDSLTVGWPEGFAPGAPGFVLRWRLDHVAEGVEATVWGVDVAAGARSYAVAPLAAATRYRFELVAVDAGGVEGSSVRGTFETLAPPVRSVSGSVVAPDAVQLAWDGPPGWLPVGYAVQWRQRGAGAFEGRLEAPAGRRSLTVTGLAGGVDYEFRVTARTAGGWQGQPLAVAVATPAVGETTLRLEVSAPHHCLAVEGYNRGKGAGGPPEGRYWVRHGVPSVPVQWRVSGGRAPYVVRVAGTETRTASGTTDVTCAKAGIDLNYLKDPDIEVIEPGPKTITIEATDAAGTTTTRTHIIEIMTFHDEGGTFIQGGVTFEPGRTYYHFGHFFETPEGERFAPEGYRLVDFVGGRGGATRVVFRRAVEGGLHTVVDADLPTYERAGMWVVDADTSWRHLGARLTVADIMAWDRFFAGMRYTPFPEGDPRNEPPVPLAGSAPSAVSGQQQVAPAPCKSPDGNDLDLKAAHLWRPYGQLSTGQQGLRCSEIVVAHPRLLGGRTITVCVEGQVFDSLFNLPDNLFREALAAAVADWNTKLAGLGRSLFALDMTSPSCPPNLGEDDAGYVRVFDRRDCQVMRTCPDDTAGSVTVNGPLDAPPRVSWNELNVFRSAGATPDAKREALKRVFRHELGHFLGLADYRWGCWRLVDSAGNVDASLMSYGQLLDDRGNPAMFADGTKDPAGCWSATITDRDLDDLHAIYHPHAVTGLRLGRGAGGRAVLSWTLPAATRTATPLSYNAVSLGVFRRAVLSRDPDTGAPAGPGTWGLLARLAVADDEYVLGDDVGGWEYAVAGLSRGDHRRGSDIGPLGLRHSPLTMLDAGRPGTRVPFTVGEVSGAVSAGAPVGVYPLAFDGWGQVHFGEAGAGGWRFSVHSGPVRVGRISVAAGDLLVVHEPATAGAPNPFEAATFVPVRIRYGATTVDVAGCRTRTAGTLGGLHVCHIDDTNFSVDPAEVPLRLVVSTAPGAVGTSALAGTYPVDRAGFDIVNYGATASGEWRFAFWGRDWPKLRLSADTTVDLGRGDVVLSYGAPYDPFRGLADSPFALGRFKPLRIRYGAATIDITACTTHFYNNGRFECHVADAFTYDVGTIPTEITVNLRPTASGAVGGAAAPPERPGDSPAGAPATCTTADLDCPRTRPDEQPAEPDNS